MTKVKVTALVQVRPMRRAVETITVKLRKICIMYCKMKVVMRVKVRWKPREVKVRVKTGTVRMVKFKSDLINYIM